MPADISQTARGYLDFSGLGQLRGKAAAHDETALRESAQQFEAMFIQMMLKSMRDTVEKSELMGSDAQDLYQDLMDREISVQLARRNSIGLADMLEREVRRQSEMRTPPTAAEMLQLRAGMQAPAALPLRNPAEPLSLRAPAAAALPVPRPAPLPLEPVPGAQP
jgi:Rod binding domain-containing protein